MLILLLYMKELGYKDEESAFYFTFRYLGVLFFSFPFGLWIKGKRLLPFFKISAYTLPFLTLLAVYSLSQGNNFLIITSFILWGLSFSLSQICKFPFILRHTPSHQLSEAITLAYATWSWGNILAGSFIFVFSHLFPTVFTSQNCIISIALLSFISLYFLNKVDKIEKLNKEAEAHKSFQLKQYNWTKIFHGLFPTFLIAIGAGMSVPFMSLYFKHTFNLSYGDYAALGFTTHFFVFFMILQSPIIKGKFGYKKAIPRTQLLAVMALIMLGILEEFSDYSYILYVAIFFFIIRQPLMNIAQPMTTEIVMEYVGEKNQEIVSALMALIWNGSFVVSGLLFAYLRMLDLSFFYIFGYTAVFYLIAILWYVWLLKKIKQ